MEKNDKLITAVVSWWAIFLGNTPIEGLNGCPEGQASLYYFSMRYPIVETSQEQVTQKQKEDFIRYFTQYLETCYQESERVTLSTDYIPLRPLLGICMKANIPNNLFPQKVTMWINFKEETVDWSIVRGANGRAYPIEEV